ncbi:alpha/beta fold hydrolase [Aestuariibacter halophilus]|uniref:Alpha/beta fold hydrolase n=1 Tax=Fluctibacter halophilus TaxID=226011 RepID=A0ABS8GBC1_9ALTE|nr:alpha/beta fold hydrolase [Aestuariibacter halophilus]MCC2617361.1 alpha/beta fold hydrolase [Aestuariibacter halophilus]
MTVMPTQTAVDENNELPDAQVILSRYTSRVIPFWKRQVVQGVFPGAQNVPIAYAYVVNPEARGSVVISSGRIESLLKYKELVFNLYHRGYSVFIHDHRGQGLSGRLTDNPHQGYVDDFRDYVIDFKRFYDSIVAPNSDRENRFLLCHSMGGAIGAQYVLAYPEDFQRVAFSAPMFGIQPALPRWLMHLVVGTHHLVNQWFGKSPWYFWGQMDYEAEPFEKNILTHCEVRYQIFREEYLKNPNIQLGGVTGRWLLAAVRAMSHIARYSRTFPIPALIMQAGEEKIVDNQAQNAVSRRFPRARKITIHGARHELLMEADYYRDQSLRAIYAFFDE